MTMMTFGPDLMHDVEAHLQEEERREQQERQRTAEIERWKQDIIDDLPTFREPMQELGYCDDEKLERIRKAYKTRNDAELVAAFKAVLEEAIQDAAERVVD